jgi:hypothetical protein
VLAEGKKLEEDLPSQWPLKTVRSSNIYVGQSTLQTYIDQMRYRRTFHANKRRNIPKGNNNYQPMLTQCQCTQFHQTYSEGPKNIYKLQHSGSGKL